MASLEQLHAALIAADKAGNVDDAKVLARAIIAMRQAPEEQSSSAPKLLNVPGVGESLLIGAGRTFDRIGKGMQQAFYGLTGDDQAQAELKARADDENKRYDMLKAERPIASSIGEALPSMAIPAGGAASLAGNMGRMALAGAIPGALEYGTVGERGGRAVLGAAAGAAVPALVGVARTAKAVAEPLYQSGREAIAGRLLNQVAGDNAGVVASKLRSAAPLVPGSMPTAAEVAESGGIAALQRAASQANPEAYTNRGMQQASARLDALRGIAGDDAAMAAAKAAREGATKDAYQAATGASYAIDSQLAELLKRPVIKKALARAEEMAANEGRPFSMSPNIPKDPSLAAGGLQRKALGDQGIVTGQGLQDLKMAIDDLLKDPASGVVGREADIVRGLRGKIIDWMEQRNPEFKAARTQYAQLSKPVDQMKVGQYLMDKAAPALADFGALGQETGATFARSLRNADQTVKAATQFKGNKSLEDVMRPDQMATLTAIAQDLARKANAQNLGRGVGSDTFQKIAMSNLAEQSGMPRMMGGLLNLPGISRGTRWIYKDADQQMQGLLADALLNPQTTAGLMTKASTPVLPNNPKTRKALEQALLRSGLLGAPAGYSLAD